MLWFQGDTLEAIKLAKTNKSLFIVVLEEETETSDNSINPWLDERLSQLTIDSSGVAINLKAKSELSNQFSQIYPVIIYPTTYFIGINGQPLEVKAGPATSDEMVESYKKALELHSKYISSTGESSQMLNSQPSFSNDMNSERTEENASSSLNVEEKAKRARELLAKRAGEKASQELENERLKELERRKLGTSLKDLQDLKQEMERKELEKETKKKREEDKKVLEKIRLDIQRDREESARKFHTEKLNQKTEAKKLEETKLEQEKEKSKEELLKKMELARIQFRLPDGSSVTNAFQSSDTLESARTFILQKYTGIFSNIQLTCLHPKRNFLEEDMPKTLLSLDLAPSAILIVLPIKSMLSNPFTSPQSTSSNILPTLWNKFLIIWTFLLSLFFPTRSSAIQPNNLVNVRDGGTAASTSNENTTVPTVEYYGARPKIPKPPNNAKQQGLKNRKDGNVHRLTANDDDEDDEQATWNGNSTQQM